MKLSGKNFQPWHDFSIDIEGLTVLTGPSNKGKSSIFRALLGVLRNELAAAYIRDPKKDPLEITLEYDGHTYTASRNKQGKVKYVIDGDNDHPFTSLDGNVPPPMGKLGFGEITVGEFTFDPIFGPQNDPQFLLDKRAYKPGDINAILGAFGGTEKFEAGRKEASSRISDKNSEAKTIAEEIRAAEERKAKLEKLSEIGETLNTALYEHEKAARGLEARLVWVREGILRKRRLEPLERLYLAIVPPDMVSAEVLTQQVTYLTQAAESRALSKWLARAVKTVDEGTEGYNSLLPKWRILQAVGNLRGLLDSRTDVPDPTPAIEQASACYTQCRVAVQSINQIRQILESRHALQTVTASLTEVDSKLTQAQDELSKGLCPKCGRPVEHECLQSK